MRYWTGVHLREMRRTQIKRKSEDKKIGSAKFGGPGPAGLQRGEMADACGEGRWRTPADAAGRVKKGPKPPGTGSLEGYSHTKRHGDGVFHATGGLYQSPETFAAGAFMSC